eukprot:11119190-Prorocentrum_lima.AAC.1
MLQEPAVELDVWPPLQAIQATKDVHALQPTKACRDCAHLFDFFEMNGYCIDAAHRCDAVMYMQYQ